MEILFEDTHILAINKPVGMLVHDDGSGDTQTVAHWIMKTYPEMRTVGEDVRVRTGAIVQKPGIVHRLDRDTTGVLLIAKTPEAFELLKEQFKSHTIQKTYHAFVYGNIKEDSGSIDRAIGKSRKDFRTYSAQRGARGTLREARTDFTVLERTPDGKASFVELHPITGRTHQIRVHMKAIHHPVVADGLYAPKGESLFGFTRTALHARSITFTHIEGHTQSIEAPYPEDFKQALLLLKK